MKGRNPTTYYLSNNRYCYISDIILFFKYFAGFWHKLF